MEKIVCPYCDTELTDEAKFCPICGEDVTEYIRKIKIDRQNQQAVAPKQLQQNADVSGKDIDEQKKMLSRFLTAFGLTLAVSIIGIIAMLVGGLV
jgi:uncharacterized Zn finger protein (UPF0148 family)